MTTSSGTERSPALEALEFGQKLSRLLQRKYAREIVRKIRDASANKALEVYLGYHPISVVFDLSMLADEATLRTKVTKIEKEAERFGIPYGYPSRAVRNFLNKK